MPRPVSVLKPSEKEPTRALPCSNIPLQPCTCNAYDDGTIISSRVAAARNQTHVSCFRALYAVGIVPVNRFENSARFDRPEMAPIDDGSVPDS